MASVVEDVHCSAIDQLQSLISICVAMAFVIMLLFRELCLFSVGMIARTSVASRSAFVDLLCRLSSLHAARRRVAFKS